MPDKDFCCVGDFPVLIPYKDLEKVVEVARNMERYERSVAQIKTQLSALRNQYVELMEKLQEIQRYL